MARRKSKTYTEDEAKDFFKDVPLVTVLWEGKSITPKAKQLAKKDGHIMAKYDDGTILVLKPSD